MALLLLWQELEIWAWWRQRSLDDGMRTTNGAPFLPSVLLKGALLSYMTLTMKRMTMTMTMMGMMMKWMMLLLLFVAVVVRSELNGNYN